MADESASRDGGELKWGGWLEYVAAFKELFERHPSAAEGVSPAALQHMVDKLTEIRSERLRWIPVSERLPECTYNGIRSATVFVMRDGTPEEGQGAFESGKWVGWCGDKGHRITHWMPIPPLPAERDGDA